MIPKQTDLELQGMRIGTESQGLTVLSSFAIRQDLANLLTHFLWSLRCKYERSNPTATVQGMPHRRCPNRSNLNLMGRFTHQKYVQSWKCNWNNTQKEHLFFLIFFFLKSVLLIAGSLILNYQERSVGISNYLFLAAMSVTFLFICLSYESLSPFFVQLLANPHSTTVEETDCSSLEDASLVFCHTTYTCKRNSYQLLSPWLQPKIRTSRQQLWPEGDFKLGKCWLEWRVEDILPAPKCLLIALMGHIKMLCV